MRPALRLLTLAAATAAILAVPASGWAADPTPQLTDPIGRPLVSTPVAPNALYARVPGASAKTVGIGDVQALHLTASSVVMDTNGTLVWVYNSAGSAIVAPFDIPDGSTVWQIDYFGYVSTAINQNNWMTCLMGMSTIGCSANPLTSTAGAGGGLVWGTRSWPTGLVIEPATSLMMDFVGSTANCGFVGAVVQYTAPSMQLYPIAPVRVYDSRFATKVGNGEKRTISVKDAINVSTGAITVHDVVPQGARAINFTITLSQTVGSGNVAVLPGGNTTVTASTINWTSSGLDIAAGSTVTLGTGPNERKITLALGGSPGATSHVIIDVTGYYM